MLLQPAHRVSRRRAQSHRSTTWQKAARALFPANLFLHDMDASDPYTFLALKRGVLQYVQVKPVLAVATLILKAAGKYEEGKISPTNGYTWVSFTYNVSVFLSLYCLGMFWKCLNDDLKPFRVTSKFLCIKGIIFFSFWQGLGISILVAAGIVKKVGPVYDPEYISMAIQDFMICLEMPSSLSRTPMLSRIRTTSTNLRTTLLAYLSTTLCATALACTMSSRTV